MIIPQDNIVSGPASDAFWIQDVSDIIKKPDIRGWSSLIGIVTAIIGNVLISVALNTQRYAHTRLNEQWIARRKLLKRLERRQMNGSKSLKESQQTNGHTQSSSGEHEPLLNSYRTEDDTQSESEPKPPQHSRESYFKSPYWWAGIILMTIGEAGNFLAYGFAPASIVSPLGVVAIISNCIIAPFFMKETFRWRDFFGVVISVAGAVTVVLSASENNPKLGPDDIWELIARWEFETYLAITVVLISILMLASNKYGHKSIFIDLGLVGLFGGYTALSTKGVASMLSYTLFKALTFPITYLLAFILVFTAAMQIKYVNRALQRFEATQVIPTQFVLFTLSVILGSAVLYRDFEKTPGKDAGKFIGGCAMTFAGVFLITSGRGTPLDEDEDEFDDEDEEAIALRAGEVYHDAPPLAATSQSSVVSTRRSTMNSVSDLSVQRRTPSIKDASPTSSAAQSPFPDTLERNHWDSQSDSTSMAGAQPSISVIGPASGRSNMNDENPWDEPVKPPLRPKSSIARILHPFTSIFPSTDSVNNPSYNSIPTERNTSTGSLVTPVGTYIDPSHLGTSVPGMDGEHPNPNLHRHSLASLVPGPFTSPLSSSLSAVVADSIRRSSRRRRRSTRATLPDEEATRRGDSAPPAPRTEYPLEPETPSRVYGTVSADEEEGDGETPTQKSKRGFRTKLSQIFNPSKRSQKRPALDPNRNGHSDV